MFMIKTLQEKMNLKKMLIWPGFYSFTLIIFVRSNMFQGFNRLMLLVCTGCKELNLRWLNRVMQDHEARASDLNQKLIFSFFFLFS